MQRPLVTDPRADRPPGHEPGPAPPAVVCDSAVWTASADGSRRRCSQGLEIFDDRPALLFGQPVAERMSAIALARPGRVVDLAALDRRHAGVGGTVRHRDAPSDPDPVVILLPGPERASEDLRPLLRVQHMINRWDGPVVEVRRRRPDAVEGRGLIPAPIEAVVRLAMRSLFLGEPALHVKPS